MTSRFFYWFFARGHMNRVTEIANESRKGAPPDDLRQAPPDMLALFGQVLMQYFPDKAHHRIAVLTRDKAQETGPGQSTVAATGVNSDPDAEFECIFWFSMEAWNLLDDHGRQAMIYHELTHCSHDEQGRPFLRPHDAGVFNEEVRIFGIWWEAAQKQFKAAKDSPMEGGKNE